MGQECCTLRKPQRSSLCEINRTSLRQSIKQKVMAEKKLCQSPSSDEIIIEHTKKGTPQVCMQTQSLHESAIFVQVLSKTKGGDEQQIIEQENSPLLIIQDQPQPCEVASPSQGKIKVPPRFEEVIVSDPGVSVASNQQSANPKSPAPYEQKPVEEQQKTLAYMSFSTNFNTVESAQSNIEQMIKKKITPGKLNIRFLRALEQQMIGKELNLKEEEPIVQIIERPYLKQVRPRKNIQLIL